MPQDRILSQEASTQSVGAPGSRLRRAALPGPGYLRLRTLSIVLLGLFSLGVVSTAGFVLASPAALQPFPRHAVIPSPGVDFVRVGDLDGDGRVDFVGLDTEFDRGTGNPIEVRLKWWRQAAPAEGQPPAEDFGTEIVIQGAPRDPATLLAVGDVDGDGHRDLLTVEPGGQVNGWLNPDGQAGFGRRTSGGRVLPEAGYVELANIDGDTGDTRDDLVLLRDDRDIQWYPSQGQAGELSLGPARSIASRGNGAAKVIALHMGDLNGDGLIDMVTASDATGDRIAWWLQRREGEDRVFERIDEGVEADVRDLSLGDLDGDGDLDILVTSQVGNQPYQVFAWLNAGDGRSFERDANVLSQSAGAESKWRSIAAADVDGDGAVDFITSEFTGTRSGGRLCWYENPADALPTATPEEPVATATSGATDPPPTPSPGPSPTNPGGEPSPTPDETATTPMPTTPTPTTWIYLPFAWR
jgi:hypothetical protein